MKLHRMLLRFGVLFAALMFVNSQAQAKVTPNLGDAGAGKGVVVFTDHDSLLQLAKSSGLKVHQVKFIKFSKRDLEKLAKLPARGCGCALPEEDAGSGWGCFKGCLQAWGVSAMTITGCAVVCVSGNLIGCAVCMGVQEWIVAGCAGYCVYSPLFTKNGQPATNAAPKSPPRQADNSQVATLSLRATHAGSSR